MLTLSTIRLSGRNNMSRERRVGEARDNSCYACKHFSARIIACLKPGVIAPTFIKHPEKTHTSCKNFWYIEESTNEPSDTKR